MVAENLGTVTGSFKVHLQTVTIEVLGIRSEAMVYFAADEQFTRSVLGRIGWLDRITLGLVDYEAKLLISPYFYVSLLSEPPINRRGVCLKASNNMGLPIGFRHVNYYRIAGKYTFSGDFFIARETIYFFPEVDLQAQREEITSVLPHSLALLALGLLYVTQKFGLSYSSRIEFWKEGLLPEEFEKHAALHIEHLKAERSRAGFGQTLPLPGRICASEISDLKLSPGGRLSFTAQSDRHDFNIGLSRKNRVRNALWEAGLGRV